MKIVRGCEFYLIQLWVKNKQSVVKRKPLGLNPSRGRFGVFELMFPSTRELDYEQIRNRQVYKRELHVNRVLNRVSLSRPNSVVIDRRRSEKIMIDIEARKALQVLGRFLLDIAILKDRIILPGNGDELQSLASQVLQAYLAKEPIPLFTPFCPDWGRNASGQYDFKSLGGDVSFIADKFFKESPPLLSAFVRHGIPYTGVLIFANWGLETKIDARDTYGRKLAQEDIGLCFASTLARTDEKLLELQGAREDGIFGKYSTIPMTDFFRNQGVYPEEIYKKAHQFFDLGNQGRKLTDQLHAASLSVNKKRLGLSESENRKQAVQNLAEYATLGHAFGDSGIVIAAESATSTRAYNLFRRQKLPVFFLKGGGGLNEGVNIL